MIWFSILVPVIITLIFFYKFKNKMLWWELLIATGVSIVIIFLIYEISIYTQESDIQYKGDLIVKCEYYEPYETWVRKTCSRTNCTGSGKTRSCHTTYYDCSYCDYNPARYVAYTSSGEQISITSAKFTELKYRWGGQWRFVELNRTINHHFGCGKDGDMYSISWDRNPKTAEPYTTTSSYENKAQAAQSAFNYVDVTDKRYLYEYPDIFDQFHQRTVLGIDTLQLSESEKTRILKKFEYLNGLYGPKKKVRAYICLFYKNSLSYATKQESLWKGGNQNEIVICIGVDPKTNEIYWVKPFGWCTKKRLNVNLREDIMETKTLNLDTVYTILEREILTNYKVSNFKERFAYLSVEPTNGAIILAFILTIIFSVGINIWAVSNEFTEASPGGSRVMRNPYLRRKL